MDIGLLYKYINFLLNKYQSGSYSPDQFNELLAATYLDPLKIKIGLPEEYQYPSQGNSGGVARQNYQGSQTITDDIRPFIRTVPITKGVNGFFPYPTDYVRYSAAEYDMITNNNTCGGQPTVDTQSIEPVTDEQKKFRKNNTIIKPNTEFPIISFEDGGFLIDPKSISSFRLTYLRKPVVPYFAYTIDPVTGDVIYDPTNSVQLEYPEIMHNDYAAMLLKYIGLNVKDMDTIQFAEQRQNTGQ
jgi:hypothetical protein